SVLTFCTAFKTPLPRYLDLSPSRSSRASCSPVEAPEGTAARPKAPDSRVTSASTVGLPRESMTWRARTRVILVDMCAAAPEWIERPNIVTKDEKWRVAIEKSRKPLAVSRKLERKTRINAEESLWRKSVRAHPYKPRVGHPQVHLVNAAPSA